MSYLDTPHLVFAGKFQADPSTINNDPHHFDDPDFRSSYELPGPGQTNGWWNPGGTAAWRFVECAVRQVVYRDGTTCDDPHLDRVVGASLSSLVGRVEAKLVDLDPEQQMVSQIWGLRVAVEPGPGLGFRSDFEVAPFADIWTRYPQGSPDSFFGAFYQSVLRVTGWNGAEGSRFFQELSASGVPEQLSIRFNVDGFVDDRSAADFTFGRVVGAIGPHLPGEPVYFVAGRALLSLPQSPPVPTLNTAYAQVEDGVLRIDLGNSLPTESVGGPLVDFGRIYAALLPADGPPVLLGEIDYTSPTWYRQTAGIVSLRLTPEQAGQAASTPLGVVAWSDVTFSFAPLLAEAPNGLWLRADQFVFRLNPGDTAATTFYATTFGRPAAGQQIALAFDSSQMQGQVKQGPIPGPPVGEPTTALTFAQTVTTGDDGTAVLDLTAGDPGNPRTYIDGQVYGITYGPGSEPPAVGSVQNPSQILSALVFSGYTIPDEPDWLMDARPILQQYANLYPVMRPIVDLDDYASVVSRREILRLVFSKPETDPNYMPVTRDLSRARREMLLKWLEGSPPLYMKLDSVEDVKEALQQAIELEHATIPPYLCALYSIKPGRNGEVAALIRSVVMEEMLHMALASNLLVSIGGSPNIGRPGFVPNYPGPLPGGLRAGLSVRLRRCSIEQIRDVFMSIEEPGETEETVHGKARPGELVERHEYTIGWFYQEIQRALETLSAAGEITFGNAERQVSDWKGPGTLYVVTSLEDAKAAIAEITEQGEGAGPLNPEDAEHELAHYYKFAEIVHGRRIVVTPDGYSFSGPHIPFDPDGVWPMMDDPDPVLLPPGSRARLLSREFARTYQALLDSLHETFNGSPGNLGDAIGLMYALSVAARQLMQTPSGLDDGTTAGPSFTLP